MVLVACQIRKHGEGPESAVFSKIGREGYSPMVAGKEQIILLQTYLGDHSREETEGEMEQAYLVSSFYPKACSLFMAYI